MPAPVQRQLRVQEAEDELFEQAAEELAIERTLSFVVGDTGGDVEAAKRVGARSCLVRSGWGHVDEVEYGRFADVVCDGVLDAAEWIIAVARAV
jgi:histidinol phosphatase-like enzyme